jgi:hypothetical protein
MGMTIRCWPTVRLHPDPRMDTDTRGSRVIPKPVAMLVTLTRYGGKHGKSIQSTQKETGQEKEEG